MILVSTSSWVCSSRNVNNNPENTNEFHEIFESKKEVNENTKQAREIKIGGAHDLV